MSTNNSPQYDTIRIEQLVLDCIIGINPWERLTKQRITIDIEVNVDLSPAGKSDAIEDTINYRTISKAITSEIEASSYGLVEALAARQVCNVDAGVVDHDRSISPTRLRGGRRRVG